MTKKLSAFQQKTLKAFHAKNTDIDIVVLYTRIYGDPGSLTVRECQQKIAPVFSKLEKKLPNGHVIEPGEVKRSYRYSTKRG